MDIAILAIQALGATAAAVAAIAAWRAAEASRASRREELALRRLQRFERIYHLLGEFNGSLMLVQTQGGHEPVAKMETAKRKLQVSLVGMDRTLRRCYKLAFYDASDADRSPDRFAEAFEELRQAVLREQEHLPEHPSPRA